MNDRVSDMLARVKNAYKVGKKTVEMPHTKMLESIAAVLKEEKYIKDFKVVEQDHKNLVLTLSYVGIEPAVSEIKRISKPGVRIYRKASEYRPVLSGMGIAILSTSQGVMSDKKAKKLGTGGEVLAELY